jgi:hypothetical protein
MATEFPLLASAKNKNSLLPKLVGPVNPSYAGSRPPTGCIPINPILARTPLDPPSMLPVPVSPDKLKAPLPFATTLDPTCCSVMVKPWAGWTQKSDVVTAVNITEQRIAARISVFIVISGFSSM